MGAPSWTSVRTNDGDLLSIDLDGHHDPAVVDGFLWEIERDPENFSIYDYADVKGYQCFAVEQLWRYLRPGDEDECEDPDESYFEYTRTPPANLDGYTAVTRLGLQEWGWDRPNCAYHLDEPSVTGLPEYLWPEEGERLATRGYVGTKHETEYLYVCHLCSTRLHDAHQEQTKVRAEWYKRLDAMGFDSHGRNLLRGGDRG